MELFQAHQQWASRPADQRFSSLTALYQQTRAYAETARERSGVPVASLRTENVNGEVQLVGKGGEPARLTHWSFGQLASRVGAPADYLRQLPATLAAQNLNHGLAKRVQADQSATVKLLAHVNGSLLLRAITSEKYSRIWNWEIAERLLDYEAMGWQPARPDFRIKSDDFPALYASDHDLFAFICHPDRVIRESGNPDGLKRGIIAINSEVGARKLILMRFFYRAMCGNHIIWGAEEVTEVSAVHVGTVRDRLAEYFVTARKILDASASADEQAIDRAKSARIAATKEGLLDALFGKRALGLSRKTIEAGYTAVNPDQDGDPLTIWGMVQGLTRASQLTPYADVRIEADRAAGRLMTAF